MVWYFIECFFGLIMLGLDIGFRVYSAPYYVLSILFVHAPMIIACVLFIKFFDQDTEKTRKQVELAFRLLIIPVISGPTLKLIF